MQRSYVVGTLRSEGTISLVLRRTLFILGMLTVWQPAWADTQVGVVVGGADTIHAQTESAIRGWLAEHTLSVSKTPLPKDGLKTLLNCLVISDMTCARSVVEARGIASNVIGVVEQVTGKHEKRSVQLSAYWVSKHHDVVSLQRTCDACTDAVLARTVDTMIGDLARMAPTMTGKIHVTSDPPGLTAMIDGQAVGATPVDHEVAFGTHTVSLSRDGHVVGDRQVEVAPEATVEANVPVRAVAPPPVAPTVVMEQRSRALPFTMIGFGVAGVVTGVVLWTHGPSGKDYYYRETRPAGIATTIGGGLVAVIGTILLFRHGSTQSVTVAPSTGGAVVGWAGRF